jgi:hypothetical protein
MKWFIVTVLCLGCFHGIGSCEDINPIKKSVVEKMKKREEKFKKAQRSFLNKKIKLGKSTKTTTVDKIEETIINVQEPSEKQLQKDKNRKKFEKRRANKNRTEITHIYRDIMEWFK